MLHRVLHAVLGHEHPRVLALRAERRQGRRRVGRGARGGGCAPAGEIRWAAPRQPAWPGARAAGPPSLPLHQKAPLRAAAPYQGTHRAPLVGQRGPLPLRLLDRHLHEVVLAHEHGGVLGQPLPELLHRGDLHKDCGPRRRRGAASAPGRQCTLRELTPAAAAAPRARPRCCSLARCFLPKFSSR